MPYTQEKNGETISLATAEELRDLDDPLIIDVRDPNEVEAKEGGEAIEGAAHVPLNMDGVKQSVRPTTVEEFADKLEASGCLPADKGHAIITHCKGGGRGHKSAELLRAMGFTNVHNGAGPDHIRQARATQADAGA